MVQVIGEGRMKPLNTSQKLGRGFSDALNMYLQHAQQEKSLEKENAALEKENVAAQRLGIDLSGINNPEMRKELLKDALLGRREKESRGFEAFTKGQQDRAQHLHEINKIREQAALGGKGGSEDREQKHQQYQNALDTVNRMRELRGKGNLGVFSKHLGIFNPKTRQHRGEYETLGNSLIQLASNIPIRNKEEFNKLSGHLSDPDVTDAEAKGILDGLEKIIKDSMSVYESEGEISERRGIGESKRPPLSDFRRR